MKEKVKKKEYSNQPGQIHNQITDISTYLSVIMPNVNVNSG
jgi:hypothetical protein